MQAQTPQVFKSEDIKVAYQRQKMKDMLRLMIVNYLKDI